MSNAPTRVIQPDDSFSLHKIYNNPKESKQRLTDGKIVVYRQVPHDAKVSEMSS